MQTMVPDTTPPADRERYDPRRFQGQGVTFKGKLIGVLAVPEARGDRMCQDALSELKMAIRAAGEHKQKIVISVSIEGLRLRDERTGDCLYHHPVHKISFIALDMTDKRAFGYVFGSPDTGHQFFGVKTEKDAGQVVMAMRDLFQVVFELKKQEMEKKKQKFVEEQLKKAGATTLSRVTSGAKSAAAGAGAGAGPSWALGRAALSDSVSSLSVHSGHSVDLLDLQMEIEHIEQGINQMDRMSPGEQSAPASPLPQVSPAAARSVPPAPAAATPPPAPAPAPVPSASDPFGDSFLPLTEPSPRLSRRSRTTSSGGSGSGGVPVAIAPPPAAKSRHSSSGSGRAAAGTPQPQLAHQSPAGGGGPSQQQQQIAGNLQFEPERRMSGDPFDLFTDLDPLGSGKAKPYIDRKDFFSELKKPRPKLGDLSSTPPQSLPGQAGAKRPLDKQTLMDLYRSEERRLSENTFGDDFSAVKFNGSAAGQTFESNFSEEPVEVERPAPVQAPVQAPVPPAPVAAAFRTDFSVFDFSAVPAGNGQPECVADSPPPFSPPPVPLPPPPPPSRRSGSSSPAPPRRAACPKQASFSSDTLSEPSQEAGQEPAPEPPPRPALVQPPPLPPKKAPSHVTMKPPARPPPSEVRWEPAAGAVSAGSPPLPVPARRPRQGWSDHPALTRTTSLGGAAVHHRRAVETASLGFTSLPPVVPDPPPPPPVNRQTKERGRTEPAPVPQLPDLLIQLQSMTLTELAAKLNISVDRLAKMSVIELAACLVASNPAPAQGSTSGPREEVTSPAAPSSGGSLAPPGGEESQEESPSEEFKSLSPISSPEVSIYKSPQLNRRDLGQVRSPQPQPLTLEEKLAESLNLSLVERRLGTAVSPASHQAAPLETVAEDVFARFDAKFPRSPVDTPNSPDDFHCEFPEPESVQQDRDHQEEPPAEDKYAVFRELAAELTGDRPPAAPMAHSETESETECDESGEPDPWCPDLAGPTTLPDPPPPPDQQTHVCSFDDDFAVSETKPARCTNGGDDSGVAAIGQPSADPFEGGDFGAASIGGAFTDLETKPSLAGWQARFDDDLVGSETERGSLADEVTFDDVRHTPPTASDDVFHQSDPWTAGGRGSTASGTLTAGFASFDQDNGSSALGGDAEFAAVTAGPGPGPGSGPGQVDPFADDEFFQSVERIQSDPFQEPFERSWASEFNATRTQPQ